MSNDDHKWTVRCNDNGVVTCAPEKATSYENPMGVQSAFSTLRRELPAIEKILAQKGIDNPTIAFDMGNAGSVATDFPGLASRLRSELELNPEQLQFTNCEVRVANNLRAVHVDSWAKIVEAERRSNEHTNDAGM